MTFVALGIIVGIGAAARHLAARRNRAAMDVPAGFNMAALVNLIVYFPSEHILVCIHA